MFLANRKTKRDNRIVPRWHVGVDLFANVGDVVVACEDGTIVGFDFFYKAKSGQPTYRLLIEHPGVVVNYGEVTADSLRKHGLKKGMRVKAGQPIAFVSDTSMLHFETYVKGTTRSYRWFKDARKPPPQLLNPTKYLLFLQQHGSGEWRTWGRRPGATPPATSPTPSMPARTPQTPTSGNGLRFLMTLFGIPPVVVETLRRGQEQLAMRLAIARGQRDVNTLTNMIFFARHSERQGRKLVRGEPNFRNLSREWLNIRDRLVRPALGVSTTVPAPRVPSTGATSSPASKPGAKVSDREVGQTLAMAAKQVPDLGITLEELLQRHKAEAEGIPIEVLLAFIHYEAGTKTFDDDTAGKWNEKYQKYIPWFYELGVFQTPAGAHGCTREGGVKRCKYKAPGYNVRESQFGKGWYYLTKTYPTEANWKDPTMQVRIGLRNLTSVGKRVAEEFPELFPSRSSEWYLRMAVLYSFSKGAGWTRAYLRKYKNELLALPESQRWDFLRDKPAYLKGRGTKPKFDPENVDKKMALAAKLRAARGATN
jgi:hypothetical protein